MTPFLARQERFGRVASTQDVVREWLETGTPEVCLALADEQTAGPVSYTHLTLPTIYSV